MKELELFIIHLIQVIQIEDPNASAATENGLPRGHSNKRSRLDDDAPAASSSSSVNDSAGVTYLTEMNKMLLLPPKNDGSKWRIQSCAVIREVLTDFWGYPKCKIRHQCDQEVCNNIMLWGKKIYVSLKIRGLDGFCSSQ